ncbi:hypothetical protein LCGC14_0464560 [marine sediment metagenome]|uniref:Methyltransferase type 11 domain-containing protein n=1 Tax=marine sediment metagenome TaxID=412755 RepID=A0A0F9SJ68_9ZZZZ
MHLRFLKKIGKVLNLDFGQLGWKSYSHQLAMHQLVSSAIPETDPEHIPIAVDIGCGSAQQSQALSKKGYEVTQVDGVDPTFKNADGHTIAKYFKSNFIKADITKELPFENDKFDIVWCSDVIEHLNDYKFTLKEMERITRKGGRLIITTPNRDFWLRRFLSLIGLLHKIESADHFYILNKKDFASLDYTIIYSGILAPTLVAYKDYDVRMI